MAKEVALAAGQWLTTYYVNDFPRLRAVLPPQATPYCWATASR